MDWVAQRPAGHTAPGLHLLQAHAQPQDPPCPLAPQELRLHEAR